MIKSKGDYLIKATAAEGMIRAFACTTKDMVSKACEIHKTSPVVSAAMGRLMSATAMMSSMMKNEEDMLTLKIEGTGPMKGIITTSKKDAFVKAYPFVSDVDLSLNDKGKLDVSEAIGAGFLSLISDTGLKEPYVGRVELISGEIAEDISYYYYISEQIPSAVSLGVLVDVDYSIICSGGFIIQLMPFCSEEIISRLEEKIKNLAPVTTMLQNGMSIEDILNEILGDMDLKINETLPCGFACDCSRTKVENALAGVGVSELKDMAEEKKDTEVECHFCKKKYIFTKEDLISLAERIK